jgi:proteasome accessory factor A
MLPDGHELRLYKNNSDHKGASYGCHENYLISPRLYEDLVYRRAPQLYHILIPFLVTRQIFCGAGKVGAEHIGAPAGFQLSQRADFFETLLGLQTMYRRPLINLRDEPHCDPQAARRLHVIVGDATMAELSTYLKVGVTQLVLAMLEADDAHDALALATPLAALGQVSRDLPGTHLLGLADGRQMTARELQLRLLELVHAFLSRYDGSDEQWEIWQEWERVLGLLPAAPALSQSLDWAIKAQVLDRYLASRQLDWANVAAWQPVIEYALSPAADLHSSRARAAEAGLPWADYEAQREAYFALRRLDLEYHDLRPGRSGGLFMQLEHQGLVERLLHDDDIEHLMAYPPAETRAWTRGAWIRDQRQRVLAADWSALLVTPADGTQQPFSVLLTHPLRGAMDSSAAIPGSPEP